MAYITYCTNNIIKISGKSYGTVFKQANYKDVRGIYKDSKIMCWNELIDLKDYIIITWLRIDHAGLNHTLHVQFTYILFFVKLYIFISRPTYIFYLYDSFLGSCQSNGPHPKQLPLVVMN